MPWNLTTWGWRRLLPLRRKAFCGFLSSLKIHRPRPGFNPRTLGLMASTLTRTPLRTTSCIVNTLHFKISVSKGDGDVVLGLTGFEVMYLATYVSKECITLTLTMEVIRSSPARPHNVTTQKTAINITCTIIITRYSHRKSCWVSSAVIVQTVRLCDIPLQSRVQEMYKYSYLSVLDRFFCNLVLVVHTKVCDKFNFCRFLFNIAVTNPGLEVRSCRNMRLLNFPNNHTAMLRCNCCCCCYGTVILCNKTFILYSSNFVVWQCTVATPELLPKLCSLLTWNSSHHGITFWKVSLFFLPPPLLWNCSVYVVCLWAGYLSLGTGWATGRSRFDPRQRRNYISSSLCVQTGSGARPASCTMGTGGPFPRAKARPGRDADHSPPSSAEVEYE
jgi:hypothetical protein